ncbi:hypothetical protein C8R45DRAFT_975769 [Mycena sanguinolenta]|nr:hypothetical protein C8R45DRAFT_975769 [Mycena sanguinolenta]
MNADVDEGEGADDRAGDGAGNSVSDGADDGVYATESKTGDFLTYYLKLSLDREFRVFALGDTAAPKNIIVRQDYLLFLDDVQKIRAELAKADPDEPESVCFFLTGRPGIGKTFGSMYFLLHLLASGQPVFVVDGSKRVTYFGRNGCYLSKNPELVDEESLENAEFIDLLADSWVLIDVGMDRAFLPAVWIQQAAVVIWTSSPNEIRMHDFRSQMQARTWYMRPWSLQEFDAVISLEFPSKRQELLQRVQKKGPVARTVFHKLDTQETEAARLNAAVQSAVNQKDYLVWEKLGNTVERAESVIYCVFLILPAEIVDESTGAVTYRRDCSQITFLSNHVAHCAAIAMTSNRKVYGKRLAAVYDADGVRTAVGPLFENILHGALERKEINEQAIQVVFGVTAIFAAVMLAGEATNFVVEAGKDTSTRPLYLRPFSTTFAAIDSILVTDEVIFLIQCTLGDRHSFVVKILLLILHQLHTKLKLPLSKLRLVYCVIGSNPEKVESVLVAATNKLEALKTAIKPVTRSTRKGKGKEVDHPELTEVPLVALAWLHKLEACGAEFDPVANTLTLNQES